MTTPRFDPTDYAGLRSHVRRAVARVCPRWLADHRDDIVQAAMMRLLAVIERSAEPATFNGTYLHKVARCALVSEIRRLRPGREVPLADGADDHLADAHAVDPARAVACRQIGEHIGAALGRLSVDRRRAVELYLQGHGVTEAARVLGWNAKRTENLVHRGLRELRGQLEACGLRP